MPRLTAVCRPYLTEIQRLRYVESAAADRRADVFARVAFVGLIIGIVALAAVV